MSVYETGIVVAFFLWVAQLCLLAAMLNSQFQRNLNKIGQRVSWTTGGAKDMDGPSRAWMTCLKLAFLILFGLVSLLLSWGYVAWAIGQVIYGWAKDQGAPEALRNYRWKMRNLNMSRDQIIKELMIVEGIETPFEECKRALLEELRGRGLPVR